MPASRRSSSSYAGIEKLTFSAKTSSGLENGVVTSVRDGVANVSGLGNVKSGEVVTILGAGGLRTRGLALNLESEAVRVLLLGSDTNVSEGQIVKCTGDLLKVKVGSALCGTVINPLGDFLTIEKKKTKVVRKLPEYYVERPAPGIIDRRSINQPLQTGIKAVDALLPIGRGQRELIIGDRQTGKTSLAVEAILTQNALIRSMVKKESLFSAEVPLRPVYSVYVAIAQKMSTIAQIYTRLVQTGAVENTVMVASTASDSASLQYLAPYAGCAIAEFFRDIGMDALIVYDDLSKHAVAYRQMSLLLRRPPGREAFPGDVFYIHSRLLERAAQLSADFGDGSLTALPIVETQAGDVSAYIPTNVISITDGQIFLETDLFYKGIRPAINAGLSVSRVGSAAQVRTMRRISGSLKLELAQFREMAAFVKFGSELDKETQSLINRGTHLTQLLIQPLNSIFTVDRQILSIFLGVNGFMDDVELSRVNLVEQSLLSFFCSSFLLKPFFFNISVEFDVSVFRFLASFYKRVSLG